MTTRTSYALLPLAAVLAAAGCSHTKTPEERTREAAERSQEAYERAADDQKALQDQQNKVKDAHEKVTEAQKALARAQQQEEQERAKADQLRNKANANLEGAERAAQQARVTASQGAPQGIQTASGSVADASADRLVIQTPGGRSMSFRIDQRTQVLVGSEQRSAADIQRGADAQVAYDASGGGQPTALTVQVTPVGGEATGTGGAAR